jgi:hypothetical protein
MNMLLFIIKYSAAVLTGSYGVYATLTDFHENRNGVRVLSKKGRLGIVLLLISTVLSLSTDGLKDYREQREVRKEQARRDEVAAEQQRTESEVAASLGTSLANARLLNSAVDHLRATSAAVKSNSRTTEMALHEARRATAPLSLEGLSIEISLAIPLNDELVQGYLKRIDSPPRRLEAPRPVQPPDGNRTDIGNWTNPGTTTTIDLLSLEGGVDYVGLRHDLHDLERDGFERISSDSDRFPRMNDGEDLYKLATSMTIYLSFRRQGKALFAGKDFRTDLTLDARCTDDKESMIRLLVMRVSMIPQWPGVPVTPNVYFTCRTKTSVAVDSNAFRSLIDFEGAKFAIEVEPSARWSQKRPTDKWIDLSIIASDGRRIDLEHVQERCGSLCFSGTIHGNDIEPNVGYLRDRLFDFK